MQDTRLHYIDWLRVSAFGLLILYHSSAAFLYDLDWLFNSPEKSQTLSLVTLFPRAWRLALLFFVSGMGTWFAFRSQTAVEFLKGRLVRLFLPLIFAMCVIIVPQVWYERLLDGRFQGSLLEFWVLRYFTEGRYPTGNFSWAHMWFVAYLLVMTVICTPIFSLLTHSHGHRLADWFERMARTPAIYLFVLLPLVLHLIFLPFFPRETNVLYNDGAWFAVWASWFGLGFLVAKHHSAIVPTVVAKRWISLGLAAALTALLWRYSWMSKAAGIGGETGGMQMVLYKTLTFSLAWTVILAAIGFAALHLNRKSAALTWLNAKIFPLYIVHQTFVVMALYYVLPLDLSLWSKLGLVIAITAGWSLLAAMLADLWPAPYRILVGLPDRRKGSAGRQPAIVAEG
ncbi:acyltransferase family protein [Mesorhizobium sp. NPDC059025]|uniref:acyltransferase family protein n=1 Tax=unclassified Mesorhizobium TaxID=325217 RepID=UPI0036CC565B